MRALPHAAVAAAHHRLVVYHSGCSQPFPVCTQRPVWSAVTIGVYLFVCPDISDINHRSTASTLIPQTTTPFSLHPAVPQLLLQMPGTDLGCAVNPDGSLKDAADIDWPFDVDDEVPSVPAAAAGSQCSG